MPGSIQAILPGVAAMANIHPMLVHFPIALLNAFLLFEIIGFITGSESARRAAGWVLYLGTAGAAAAVAAGVHAASTVRHADEVHAIMTRHMYLGFAVLSLAVVLSLWRVVRGGGSPQRASLPYLLLAIATSVVMAFGADLGGLMVYGHGVGVRVEGAASAPGQVGGHAHGGAGSHDEVRSGDDGHGADGGHSH